MMPRCVIVSTFEICSKACGMSAMSASWTFKTSTFSSNRNSVCAVVRGMKTAEFLELKRPPPMAN